MTLTPSRWGIQRCLLGLMVLPELATAAELDGTQLTAIWGLPFAGILLSIALAPLLLPQFWHHHYGKVAAGWSLAFLLPFAAVFGISAAGGNLVHALLAEYIPFILLLTALFTVSGGIYIRGNLHGSPGLNASILAIGAVLASFMGTTGASMLLIRPLIRANDNRKHVAHVVVFFIFIVSNAGGSLTPLGDPPLFLGFLKGVDFFWTVKNIFPESLFLIGSLLVIFYALFMTGSRSSLIGVLLIIFFHINQTKRQGLKIAIIAGVLLVVPFAIQQVILKGGDKERLEEILTLTGRLPFWQALITEGLPREPLLGFGYMRIDYKEFFQSVHTYPGKMTHNTFMQVLMNLGFIGFTIVLFQVFFTVKSILSAQKELKLMLIGILIPIIINSFTEFGIFGESNYGILFYQIIIFSIAFRNNNHLTRVQRIILQKKRPDLTT